MSRASKRAHRYRRLQRWADRLYAWGATPNGVSWASIGFALLAGVAFWLALRDPPGSGTVLLLVAAVCLQARLLCNRLDGALAKRSGLIGKAGDIYNDAPDRAADALVFLGAGYGLTTWYAWGADLGWAAALLSVSTAYVRVLGIACGLREHKDGPMARQHRMQAMTIAAVAAAIALAVGYSMIAGAVLAGTVGLVVVGAAVTVALRLRAIVRELEAR